MTKRSACGAHDVLICRLGELPPDLSREGRSTASARPKGPTCDAG